VILRLDRYINTRSITSTLDIDLVSVFAGLLVAIGFGNGIDFERSWVVDKSAE
jgi:hypothetical protein